MKKQLQSISSFINQKLAVLVLMGCIGVYQTNAQVTLTATAGTTGPTIYTTVNAALAAISAGTHQGDIIITVTANTTEPAPNQLVASGSRSASYSSVIIKPLGNVVVNSAASPTIGRGILEFIGADNITIDGDDPTTPGSRNLTFQVAISTPSGIGTSALRFSSSAAAGGTGCRNVVIKNCILIGGRNSATSGTLGFCITASGQTNGAIFNATTQASDNDNWLVENNEFKRALYGFHAYGHSTNVMDSLVIRNNKFGNDSSDINIGLCGIYLGYTALTANVGSAIIEGNDIQGGDYTTGWSSNVSGVNLAPGNSGAILRNNYIHDIAQPALGSGAYGVIISETTLNNAINIYNNIIKDITAFHTSSIPTSSVNCGIYCAEGTTNLRLNHNTIVLNKPNAGAGPNNFSSCIFLNNAVLTLNEFRNNILVNNQSDAAGQACLNVYLDTVAIFTNSGKVDRNSYWVSGVSRTLGATRATSFLTLADWKTATTKDTNSFYTNPPFISIVNNLRLQAGVKSPLESNGAATFVTTDIDGNARPGPAGSINGGGTLPDIGAHEADMLPDLFSADSVKTTQVIQNVIPGDTSKAIMNIQVYVSGSFGSPLTLNSLLLNTAGTTNSANLTEAKVFYTGSSKTYSTNELYGSVSSPSGSFTVTGSKLLKEGVNNFWVAYSISALATSGNLADVRVDTLSIGSIRLVPANGNPSGSITILNPMTYISSDVTQSTISSVYLNETNREVIGLRVIMSSTGAPALVSSININLNGTTDTADISNIKIWYTGNNKTFATTSQFGATVPFAPAIAAPFGFSLAGLQSVLNDTNYFWVTFDIKITATALNVIDAEITQLTVAGTSQIPAVTTAFGNRTIRLPYCAAEPAFGGDTDIGRVQLLDNMNNAIFSNGSAQPILNNPAATGTYSNFTTLPPANLLRSSTYSIAVDQITSGGFFFEAGLTVYVDWNDDGDFLDAGEAVYILPNRTGPTGTTDVTSLQGSFRVPCNAVLGNVRMRVILEESGSATPSCGTFAFGEVEDYVINIVDNPIVFKHIGTQQQTGVVAVGATNRPIMRIPVRVDGCGTAVLTQVKMSTTGSTSVANIVSAKLYRTVGNTFNTTDLRQTIPSPSGSFTFTLTDTLAITNDTINYWLAYDVSTSAVVNNLLDAVLDSMEILGSYRVPANGNPSGSITILNPMTFVSATTAQIDVSRVAQNSTDNNIISIEVLTSATGAPIDATQFTVNLNGTPDTANISNIKIWYTGSSNTFAANTQFGATVPFAPATTAPFSLTISGNQGLVNGTNYFWLTYDIKQFATLGGIVDGECTDLTIDGTPQIPIVTAPSGNREIRPPYCSSSASFNFDSEILNVTIGSLNNTSNCSIAAPGAGSSLRQYSNFTILPAPNLVSGSTVPFSVHTATCNSNTSGMLGIWIDFNQNGSFLDAGEQVYMSATPFGLGFFATGNITIPCGSSIGRTGMRVIISENNTSILPCGAYFLGETEDYMVNILPGSLVFNSVGAVQQTGAVDKGTLDVPITRIPLRVDGCDSAVLTEIRMSTTGTTNASDISSAKLYRTINSTFNTADLLQTVSSPSGQFTFVLTDTLLVQNDTINYWLAYDVSTSASYGNFIDATLDSINVLGTYRLPANGNPFGKVKIAPPMTFVSATSTQSARNKVIKGTINNQIIGMQIVMSDTGSTSGLTQINFNLDGTVDTADIENIRVWYTGNSNVFATTTQFGTTVPFAPATSYPFAITLTGTQLLRNGTNYFWVTYDIKNTATTTNIVDAEFTGLIVSGGAQTPTITAPIGFREIMAPYCIPTLLGCAGDFISQVTTIGAAVNINNATSCNGNINGYIQYENITPAATIGATFTVQVMAGGSTNGLGIWIDYNNDGIFSSSEFVFSAAPSLSTLQTGTITIPVTATVGLTRMRVRAMFNYTPLAADACLPINWGETEDYNFNILPLPPPTTYTWNQTSPASYTVGSNWTPARNTLYENDILVFNTGSSITVTNVPTQTISKLVVNNNTRVTLNTTSIANLTIADSLNLISGTIVAGTNITPIVGRSATATGVITGAGGVEGNLTRWIAAATRSYTFPLVKGANRRSATINYTTAPTGGELNLSYVNGAPFTGGLPLVDGALLLDSISKDGIWRLSAPTLLSPGTFNITINANNIGGVTNYATTALVSRSSPIGPWTAFGAQVITSGSNTAMVLSRTGLTVSNIEIGIAGTSVNPLPVSLTSFTGTATGIDGILNWSTSTETNNQGFQVERSKDGRSFESTGYFVKGVGNSRIVKNYSLLDVNAFAKADVIYYRLKQVDVDGKFTYSQVIKVSTLASAVKGLLAFPNPYNSSYNVVFNAATEGTAIIEMTDIQGRIITRQTSVVTIGENEIPVNNASAVNAGFYFVRLTKDGETTVIKLVKN